MRKRAPLLRMKVTPFHPYRQTEYNKRMRKSYSFLTEKRQINLENNTNILSMENSTQKV